MPGSNVGELYGNLGGSKPPRISVPCRILRLYLTFGYDRGERLPFPGSPPAVLWVNEDSERADRARGGAEDVKPTDIRVRAAEGALEKYRDI